MKKFKKVAAALALGAMVSGQAEAQLSNTLYFHHYNYRSHFVNPSKMPDNKFYFGFPALGTVAVAGGNNSFSFGDIIKKTTKNGLPATVLVLDESIPNGQEKFLDEVGKNWHVNSSARVHVLDFGFTTGDKGYFSFTLGVRAEAHTFIPKKFFEVVLDGMPEESNFNLDADNISVNAQGLVDLGFGYTRQVNDKISVGGALHVLKGAGDVKSKFKGINISGGLDEWKISGDCDIYTSLPGAKVTNKPEGGVDFDVDTDDYTAGDFMKGNWGGSIDFGVNYKLTDKLTLSANVLDLGFVRYNNYANKMTLDKDFHFNGGVFDIKDQNLDINLDDDFEDCFKGDGDAKYNHWLTTKVYMGAEYELSKRFSLGALSKTSFLNGHVWEDFLVSANIHPIRLFSWTVAYNIYDHQWNGLSTGLTLNLGPFQIFVAVDNIPVKFVKTTDDIMIPYKTQYVRTNVGVGFEFNFRDKKKKLGDEDDSPTDEYEEPEPDFYDADGDGVMDAKDRCPGTPAGIEVDFMGCPLDADKDGVPDYQDECDNTPAGVSVDEKGCPVDSDKDGVADYLDACPDTPEGMPVDAQGCPIDEDRDGVPDELDACPNTPAGVSVDSKGCPVDTDKDGVPDYLDKCPEIPGVKSNGGCPEVKQEVKQLFKKALNGIQFQTGKATILKSSYGILDQIANTMKENPTYKLNIFGHTDNVGNPASNLQLSKDRANSVMQYLINKGVESGRLTSEGFGDTKPVVPNTTSANKAKNRRVEFEVEFEQVISE